MRAFTTIHLWLGVLPAVALAGCMANEDVASSSSDSSATTAAIGREPVPGGGARWGNSIATMADQYNRPHPGSVAAAGASAWVPPAPPPAMVVTDLPPAAPAAPPPAAVANRQPTPAPTRPAVDASSIVRPEAGAPEMAAATPAAPTLSAATRDAGRKLFSEYSCGACHTLADAGTSGSIGPSLDRNSRLTRPFVIETVSEGRGAMPSFAGQMTDAEIATLADYIIGAKR